MKKVYESAILYQKKKKERYRTDENYRKSILKKQKAYRLSVGNKIFKNRLLNDKEFREAYRKRKREANLRYLERNREKIIEWRRKYNLENKEALNQAARNRYKLLSREEKDEINRKKRILRNTPNGKLGLKKEYAKKKYGDDRLGILLMDLKKEISKRR